MDTSIHPHILETEIAEARSVAGQVHQVSFGPRLQTGHILFVWGHGWGQDHKAFGAMIDSLQAFPHIALDFPGFGMSSAPPSPWGTATYAEMVAEIIAPLKAGGAKIIWVGHSFGGRVGIQLAAHHPALVDGLCILAGAGLPCRRSPLEAIRILARRSTFKLARSLLRLLGKDPEGLRLRFGSADYRTAGLMRPVLVRVIAEDLSQVATHVQCPTMLVYGEDDRETPPEIGRRFASLMRNAELSILPHQNHYSLLEDGRHLVLRRLAVLSQRICSRLPA